MCNQRKCHQKMCRILPILGTRAVVSQAERRDDPLSLWATGIAVRSHANVGAAALASKTVCIAWSMLRNQAGYNPALATASQKPVCNP